MPMWIYDAASLRKKLNKMWVYDAATNRKAIQKAWVYDAAGNRKLIFSAGGSPSASNFSLVDASALSDTLEGSQYGIGYGQFGGSNDNFPCTTVPAPPVPLPGTGAIRCVFTSNANSGDVGLPPNLFILGVTPQVVPNTDATFASITVQGIGTFLRSNATYYPNGANSQGSEWHWTHPGPYFNYGADHAVQFT